MRSFFGMTGIVNNSDCIGVSMVFGYNPLNPVAESLLVPMDIRQGSRRCFCQKSDRLSTFSLQRRDLSTNVTFEMLTRSKFFDVPFVVIDCRLYGFAWGNLAGANKAFLCLNFRPESNSLNLLHKDLRTLKKVTRFFTGRSPTYPPAFQFFHISETGHIDKISSENLTFF